MTRGDVWWADLPAPVGTRPVLILTREVACPVRTALTVAFLTTTVRNIPVEVKLLPADGVPKECVVNLDVINTIPKTALKRHICSLSPAKMLQVRKSGKFALGL